MGGRLSVLPTEQAAGLPGCPGGGRGRRGWEVEHLGCFEAMPGREGFIRRSTESAGAPQEQMCIAGGSLGLLCGGLEGGKAEAKAKGTAKGLC